ncbi:MFS transporter [Gulosibacter sp. 10]|uniref:MFS transporter n=1 Tax=Gulosibacter sp. 10 TaxID=1255570 RepID=UPI00097F1B50|nr:MFS transporter [Gulosibacter sp. 10]SJM47711.1 L-Proline/Glycine betaine transporter ProP [Gulosibacter sp. 10]
MTTSPTTTASAAPQDQEPAITLAGRRRSLLSSTAGNILEWYEWSAYSVMSPFIAVAMFDQANPASAILSVFAVFAVGFLMRPIGGIFFGWLGDRIGRKRILVTTMLLMAAACFLIGVMPTFAQWGIGASLLLLLLRCIQGFAHGGESSASTTYVAEIAPAAKRGRWGSVAGISIIGGSVLAFVFSAVLTSALGEEAMQAYGWRIPFLVAGGMALVVLWMRRRMHESDVFEESEGRAVEKLPRRKVVRITIRMIAFTSGLTCMNYVWMTYMTTYAINEQGMLADAAYWATAIGQVVCLVSMPFLGALSDRIGRKPMLLVFAVLTFVTTVPFSLMVGDQWWSLTIPVAASLVIWALGQSIFPAIQAENFPTYIRGRGIGFAYSISVALFGGTAPYLNQLFVSLGTPWLFYAYVMGLSVVSFVAALCFRETKGADLNDLEL